MCRNRETREKVEKTEIAFHPISFYLVGLIVVTFFLLLAKGAFNSIGVRIDFWERLDNGPEEFGVSH